MARKAPIRPLFTIPLWRTKSEFEANATPVTLGSLIKVAAGGSAPWFESARASRAGENHAAAGAPTQEVATLAASAVDFLAGQSEGGRVRAVKEAKEHTKSDAKPDPVKTPEDGVRVEFTEEQDATLIRMKEANNSWAKIAAELGLQKKAVTNRYGQLRKSGKASNSDKSTSKLDKDERTAEDVSRNLVREQGMARQGHKSESMDNKQTNGNATGHETKQAKAPEGFHLENPTTKWLWISSRYYDQTGKRMTAQDAEVFCEDGVFAREAAHYMEYDNETDPCFYNDA